MKLASDGDQKRKQNGVCGWKRGTGEEEERGAGGGGGGEAGVKKKK